MRLTSLIAVIFLGMTAAAADESAMREYRGKISELDRGAQTLTLETSAGPAYFVVGEDSHIVSESREVSFDHLAVGQKVEVAAPLPGGDASKPAPVLSVEIVDPVAISGQLEELPTVAAADTVTIVGIDLASGALDVETKDGPRRYHVDEKTRIRSSSETLGLGDLEQGQRVAVSARREGDQFIATDVIIVAVGPEPAPARSQKEAD